MATPVPSGVEISLADDVRGLTLRELVLEVRSDVKSVRKQFAEHLLEHERAKGERQGEARLFGIARSSVALIVSLIGGGAAVWGLLH